MPAVMEDKVIGSDFQGFLSDIERNMAVVTIVRSGRPVARIVPLRQKRCVEPIPGYSDKVKINCDLFADESDLWENLSIPSEAARRRFPQNGSSKL